MMTPRWFLFWWGWDGEPPPRKPLSRAVGRNHSRLLLFVCCNTRASHHNSHPPLTPGRLLMDAYEKLEKIGEGTYGKVRARKDARAQRSKLRERASDARALSRSTHHPPIHRCTKRVRRRTAAWWRSRRRGWR